MKPFLPSSKARSFAETNWGTGGTNAYKTNRKGVFYFSCSGHGGYVVDADRLTPEEYSNIKQYYPNPDKCLVITRGGKITFWQNPVTARRQSYRVYPDIERHTKEVFFFEEDCDWAILEKFTDIRVIDKGIRGPEYQFSEEHKQEVERTFNQWIAPRTQTQEAA